MSTLANDRNKFTHRPQSCVLLGCPPGFKGYKVLNLETNTVSISRNVVFHETIFPFKTNSTYVPSLDLFSKSILPLPIPDILDYIITYL